LLHIVVAACKEKGMGYISFNLKLALAAFANQVTCTSKNLVLVMGSKQRRDAK